MQGFQAYLLQSSDLKVFSKVVLGYQDTICDDNNVNIPKNSLTTGVLDVDDQQEPLVNAGGRSRVVELVKVGKELVKTYVEKVKEGTKDLVDNGDLVGEGIVISSMFHSEIDQNV